MRTLRRVVVLLAAQMMSLSCNSGSPSRSDGGDPVTDSGQPADMTSHDAGATLDAGAIDSGVDADAGLITDAGTSALSYSCNKYSESSGWQTGTGYRAVVVASADAGLSSPVALTFAGDEYEGRLFVVNQGNNSVVSLKLGDGAPNLFSVTNAPAPLLLTTIVWDDRKLFDGALYVGDQGTDGDQDSRVYRLLASGEFQLFVSAPGPGLDDIYGLAFTPSNWPTQGLLVTGDTDSPSAPQWGLISDAGVLSPFSTISGIEGLAVDMTGSFGAELLASRPSGGGYSGDDTVTRILSDGGSGGAIVSNVAGVHAVTVAPPGPFGGKAYAASWQSQQIFAIESDGGISPLVTGLNLTNYDGNILAFSPDGKVLLVADRSAHRIVCIEPE